MRRIAVVLVALVIAWLAASQVFHLPPVAFARQFTRVIATPGAAFLYRADERGVSDITEHYRVGMKPRPPASSASSWQELAARLPGIELLDPEHIVEVGDPAPFVYETSSARFLSDFRNTYHLDDVLRGATDEYDAMLKLAAWVGTRFDHGTDLVPGGNQVCDPTAVVASGAAGKKYWCEIAARVMVHAANAVGWQARIITGSRDGYTWEHAVAEVWSNQFDKWIAIDTDFNVIYEEGGVPLSAFELSSRGERLRDEKRLIVRSIAPAKASLPPKDLMPYYEYVHVDLRTDWCTRPLRAGSPAGGDLATWWMARPSLPRILTARVRVDDPAKFDWKVNNVALVALDGRRLENGGMQVSVALAGYSPAFDHFETTLDAGEWQRVEGDRFEANLTTGDHVVQARLVTSAGSRGPVSSIRLRVNPVGGS